MDWVEPAASSSANAARGSVITAGKSQLRNDVPLPTGTIGANRSRILATRPRGCWSWGLRRQHMAPIAPAVYLPATAAGSGCIAHFIKPASANKAKSLHRDDDLRLIDCAITAVCHCAPPDNKPTRDEIAACRPFLTETFDAVPVRVFLALGQIAWQAIVDEARGRGWHTGARPKFGHGAVSELTGGRWLLASYHPSQQNTFTGKLIEPMFDAVFEKARRLLNS